jgi:hypothetical protein
MKRWATACEVTFQVCNPMMRRKLTGTALSLAADRLTVTITASGKAAPVSSDFVA